MLFAVLSLDWSSNMVAVSNAVAFLTTLGVGTLFGSVCLVTVLGDLVSLFGPGLVCLFVSVHAGLVGLVLSWFGRPGIPGQVWLRLLFSALLI